MRKLFIVFLSVLMMSTASAQSFVRMYAEKAKKGDLKVTDLSIDVKIRGNIATTTVDFIFANNSDQILEGEFEFPLGENQYITGYALDINGKLRQGVVVEKEKGRIVLEDKIRQGIDPGIVEKTKGNNFKTRVYPLPARGSRHIQITYEEEIRPNSRNLRKYELMPLIRENVNNFSFTANVAGKEESPVISMAGNSSVNFGAWNSGYNVNFSRKDFSFNGPIVINLPEQSDSCGILAEDSGRDTIFYYHTPVDSKKMAKSPIKKLSVYWDASASGKNRNLEKELALLEKYVDSMVTDTVEIVLFANTVVERRTFKASAIKEINEYLKTVAYDGATNMEDLIYLMRTSGYDEVLVFTDGLVNWNGQKGQSKITGNGQKGQSKMSSSAPISVISSSPSADFGYMKEFAQKNNGSFVNLVAKSEDEGLEVLKNQPYRLISVEYDENLLKELYPSAGTEIDGSFSMSGILKRKSGTVKLCFGWGNKVSETKTIEITDKGDRVIWNTSPDGFVSRLWAQKKIESLSCSYEKNKDEILELSKKYGIVTKDTSLIVLDSVNDYVRYGIVPPEELLEDYNRIAGNRPKVQEKETGISQKVLNDFNAFREWWNKKPEDFKKKTEKPVKGPRRRALPQDDIVYSYSLSEDMAINEIEMETNAVAAPMAGARGMAASENGSLSLSKSKATETDSKGSKISIQPWNPSADYIHVLKRIPENKMYSKYLEIKEEYENSPMFFMDVADYFWEEELKSEALRILSNLSEMQLENTDIVRALGNKLIEWGQTSSDMNAYAVKVFESLIDIKGEIPLFYRDYALACEKIGEYQKACDALYHIAEGNWDGRYSEIEQIALNDMNSIIAAHEKSVDVSAYEKSVLQNFPVDIRIVLTWNTDDCDIDLWVTDPDKEKCFYANRITQLGGRNSRDFTQGYGPEEFCIKKAKSGKYKIEADYYGTRSQKILQPVVVQAEVYTDFGTSQQKCQIMTLQLENVKGNYMVGTIEID